MVKILDCDPKNTIAFQGNEGTHTEYACKQAYPFMQTLACHTFEQVVKAVEDGRASLGLAPVENSHIGRLAEIHEIIPDTPLYIVGELIQHIEYVIAGVEDSKLEEIEILYSHPLAFDSCKNKIKELGIVNCENHSNIALAASNIAKWNDPKKAALTSKLAAENNNLVILKEHVEDQNNNNLAMFAIIAKEMPDIEDDNAVTSLVFTVPNNFAILSKALGGFATNNIKLIKIETTIENIVSNNSSVYLSFIGNPINKLVKQALKELDFFAEKIKILGVYPADKKRFEK